MSLESDRPIPSIELILVSADTQVLETVLETVSGRGKKLHRNISTYNKSNNQLRREFFWLLDNFKTVTCELKWNVVDVFFHLTESSLHSEDWTIWPFVETKQRKLAYSVYCTMKVISAVLTTCSLLMSPKHLIVVGTHPKWIYVTFSDLITYSCVCPFRLELRRNGEEELKAPGEVLRIKLLLGQEDQEVY